MDKWLEILIEVIVFIISSYLIFYKSFINAMGKETAKLITREELITIEENVKKDFKEGLEEVKSSLAKENISHQIEFEFLHKRRAEVAVEIYQKLQELHSASFDRTRGVHLVIEDGKREEEERQERLQKALNDFRTYFVNNKLFFSIAFCNSITKLLNDYWRKTQEYIYRQERIRNGVLSNEENGEYLELLNRISEEINTIIPIQLRIIEQNIRGILKIEE